MQVSDITFRASSLGNLMSSAGSITDLQLRKIAELSAKTKLTDLQAKELETLIYKRDNPELPKGVKTHLLDVFLSWKYGCREIAFSKFMEKGLKVEEDAITLLCQINKTRGYNKNEVHFNNGFIAGTPDIVCDIEGHEIKSSWSMHTFGRAISEPVDSLYEWQCKAYMWLTGRKVWNLHRIVVNATADLINDEKRKLLYAFRGEENNDEYISLCRQIEVNMIYDLPQFKADYPYYDFHNPSNWERYIPIEERIHTVRFEHDPKDDKRIEERVMQGREYIANTLLKDFVSRNK